MKNFLMACLLLLSAPALFAASCCGLRSTRVVPQTYAVRVSAPSPVHTAPFAEYSAAHVPGLARARASQQRVVSEQRAKKSAEREDSNPTRYDEPNSYSHSHDAIGAGGLPAAVQLTNFVTRSVHINSEGTVTIHGDSLRVNKHRASKRLVFSTVPGQDALRSLESAGSAVPLAAYKAPVFGGRAVAGGDL